MPNIDARANREHAAMTRRFRRPWLLATTILLASAAPAVSAQERDASRPPQAPAGQARLALGADVRIRLSNRRRLEGVFLGAQPGHYLIEVGAPRRSRSIVASAEAARRETLAIAIDAVAHVRVGRLGGPPSAWLADSAAWAAAPQPEEVTR